MERNDHPVMAAQSGLANGQAGPATVLGEPGSVQQHVEATVSAQTVGRDSAHQEADSQDAVGAKTAKRSKPGQDKGSKAKPGSQAQQGKTGQAKAKTDKGEPKGKTTVKASTTTIARAQPSAPTIDHRRDVMQAIGERIANGESLMAICKEANMPSRYTILSWVADDPMVHNIYRNALAMRAERYAEQIVDLADEARGKSAEEVQALKLMVNSRQWVASRLLPKLYGDHQVVEHTGQVQVDPAQVDQRLALLLRRMQAIEVKQ